MTLPFAIPVLETERLILRAPCEADLPAIVAFRASDRTAYIGGPQDAMQSWQRFLAQIGHWALRGYGWWVIEDRATGAVAGRAGASFHPNYPEPELGWQIYDGFEGRGLAFEAALAARRHAQTVMGLGPLMSMIDPANIRSLALARRLGAAFERMSEIDGQAVEIWRHPGGAT
jgi:RimJ/RimL family protein N-acetyltransferase